MAANKEDTCVSPWFGFAVIFLVCVLVTSAIFVEFRKPSPRARRSKAAKAKNGVQVGYARPVTAPDQGADSKVIF